jgi:hypothetical protein
MTEAQQEDRSREGKTERMPAVSRCLSDGTLIELVYRAEEAETAFAVSRGGAWTIEDHVDAGGERLVPFSPRNNVIRKRQLIDTLPAGERRVECGRHGRFGEHDGC